jgi:chromate transporter
VVVRRKWLTEEQFLDLLGATNLIPWPKFTEMAIPSGFLRAGWAAYRGWRPLYHPAMIAVTALAWLYRQYGSIPQVSWLLYGIKPVVITS